MSPSLDDIDFSWQIFQAIDHFRAKEFIGLLRLISYSAARCVWTYSPPSDGSLPDDEKILARIAWLTVGEWRKLRVELDRLGYLIENEGKLYVRKDFFRVNIGFRRPSIPAPLRMRVLRRDSFTCGYCGNNDGPFDVDHIIPIVQGGSLLDEDNLICACARCNRSKGGNTPTEWLERIGGGGTCLESAQ